MQVTCAMKFLFSYLLAYYKFLDFFTLSWFSIKEIWIENWNLSNLTSCTVRWQRCRSLSSAGLRHFGWKKYHENINMHIYWWFRFLCKKVPNGLTRQPKNFFLIVLTMDDHQTCPKCKTTKYRNPSMVLMVNNCGHALCESCVDLIFNKGTLFFLNTENSVWCHACFGYM